MPRYHVPSCPFLQAPKSPKIVLGAFRRRVKMQAMGPLQQQCQMRFGFGAVAAAPSLQPGRRRQELGYYCACGGLTLSYAACPTAQMKPASSRATATAATVERFPLLTILRNFLCSL